MVEASPYQAEKLEETKQAPSLQTPAEDIVQPQTYPQPQPDAKVIYVQTFKSSELEKSSKMHDYLQSRLADPFNKYCIDCKHNISTHCLVMYGAFMCGQCANQHKMTFGFFETYPKDLLTEQFDDYQLASVAEQIGGNKPIYDLFVEYNIQALDSYTRFNSKIFAWYKRRHQCSITGVVFSEDKPSKTIGEAVDRTAVKAKKVTDEVIKDIKKIDTTAIKSKVKGWWSKVRGNANAAEE